MKQSQSNPAGHSKIVVPPGFWPNVLSLDAVAIGLLWQLVFVCQFSGRWPVAYEAAIVGLSIWLVYTADRLFDAARLDVRRPHTLRHRFHFQNRNVLIIVWLAALGLDTCLIIHFATDSQLRWGYMAVAAVVAYVVGVQLAPGTARWLPKEMQAGMIFAYGVSLTAWAEPNPFNLPSLFTSTLMAGLLFSANCLAIAFWERNLDREQEFDSSASRFPEICRLLPIALLVHALVSVCMLFIQVLPPLITGCFVVSDLLLLSLVVAGGGAAARILEPSSPGAAVRSVATLADLTLAIPPLILAAAGAIGG